MDFLVVIADVFGGLAVLLMIFILKITTKHEKRIQKMENDLYLNPGNPTSMPLTQQVHNLQQDMSMVKKTCDSLEKGIGKLNEMVTHFYNSNFKK